MKIEEFDNLYLNSVGLRMPEPFFFGVQNAGVTAPDPALRSVLLERGLQYHETGRLELAQAIYRQLLEIQPNDADALHLLGVIALQTGSYFASVEYIEQAISIHAVNPLYYNNLGSAYRALQRFDDAHRCFAQSIALNPDSADAHYNLGIISDDRGEREQAEVCFRRTLALRPGFTPAYFNLGIMLRRNGKLDEALVCFQQVLQAEPDNAVAGFLAAALAGKRIERAPDQYVASVFDLDAKKFDRHLIEELGYDTPQRLLELTVVPATVDREKWRMLDLGCGTGLVAQAFAPHVGEMVGVDLSAAMLERARMRGVYSRLEQAELLTMMQHEPEATYDLVAAADVFIYYGRLDQVFAQASRLLRTGGRFVFSVESLEALVSVPSDLVDLPSAHEYVLHAAGRFAHSAEYITGLALQYGFKVNCMVSAPARVEKGNAVMAWLTVLEKERTHITSCA